MEIHTRCIRCKENKINQFEMYQEAINFLEEHRRDSSEFLCNECWEIRDELMDELKKIKKKAMEDFYNAIPNK